MSNFIEIHIRPKNEASIVRSASISWVWASPNGGSMIFLNGSSDPLQVSDSYEDLRKMLIGEGKV